jgi:hypothetical protein
MRGIVTRRGAASPRYAAAAILLALVASAAWAVPARATNLFGFNRETYAYSSQYSVSQEAGMYRQIVLQSTNGNLVKQLKAANPNVTVLVYMGLFEAASTKTTPNYCTSGVTDLASHPSWLLYDQNGKPILSHGTYLADPGNTGYQQACVAAAIAKAKASGFDGVYWDSLNQQLNWSLPSGTTVAKYSSASAWQNATTSMLAYAKQQIHANGLQIWGNIGGSFLTSGLWQRWNGYLDGAEDEGFSDPGSGLVAGVWSWPMQVANIAWSEANHKPLIIHSHNATEAGNTYGLASMLLAAGGESTYSTSNNCYSSCEAWYPEYAQALYLGQPVGTYAKLPSGVYWRWFQHGLVLVNPSTASVPAFSLGGGLYSGSHLTNVSSLSMAPTTGYVLLANKGNTVIKPAVKSVPSISGTVAVGKSLTTSNGSWTGTPTPTYTYQWSRCTTSCTAISGATNRSYTVQSADKGHHLVVRVTATNSGGIASASSAATTTVP